MAQPVEGAGLAVPPVVPPQLIPTILWPPVGRDPHRLLAALCTQHEPRSRAGPKGGLPCGKLCAPVNTWQVPTKGGKAPGSPSKGPGSPGKPDFQGKAHKLYMQHGKVR